MPRPRSMSAAPFLERSALRLVNHGQLDYSDESELSRPCSATPLDTLVGYRAVSPDLCNTDSPMYPHSHTYPSCSHDLAFCATRPPSPRPASIAGETCDATCGRDLYDRRGAHSAPPHLVPTAWVFSSLWKSSHYDEDAKAIADMLRTSQGQAIDMLPLDDTITAHNTTGICQALQDLSEHFVQNLPCNRTADSSTTSHLEQAVLTVPDSTPFNKKGSRKGRHERERARDSGVSKNTASSATETLRRRAEKRQKKRAKRAAKKATAKAHDVLGLLSQCESGPHPSAYAVLDVSPQLDLSAPSELSSLCSHNNPATAEIDSLPAVKTQSALEASQLASLPSSDVPSPDIQKSVYGPDRLLQFPTSETISVNIPGQRERSCDAQVTSVQSKAVGASVQKVAQEQQATFSRMPLELFKRHTCKKLDQNTTSELPHNTSTACRAAIASALGLTPFELVRKDLVSLSGYACFRVGSDDCRPEVVIPARSLWHSAPRQDNKDGAFRQPMVARISANNQADQQDASATALAGFNRKTKHKRRTKTKSLNQHAPAGDGGEWQSQDASIHSTSAPDSRAAVFTVFSDCDTDATSLTAPHLSSNTQPVPLPFLRNVSSGEIPNLFYNSGAHSATVSSPTVNSTTISLSSPSSPSMLVNNQLSNGEARMYSSWVLLFAIVKRLQYLKAKAEDFIKLEEGAFHLGDKVLSRMRLCSSAVEDFVQSMRAQAFHGSRHICVTMCPDELTRQLLIAEALYARACGLREPSWRTVCEAMWDDIADRCP